MSEFVKAATSFNTRQAVHDRFYPLTVRRSVEESTPQSYPIHYRYNFEVNWRRLFVAPATMRDNIEYQFRRELNEAIYGDFRPFLYRLRAALYNQNTSEIEQVITDMEHIVNGEYIV